MTRHVASQVHREAIRLHFAIESQFVDYFEAYSVQQDFFWRDEQGIWCTDKLSFDNLYDFYW